MQYLLDTNVISEQTRPVPDETVLRWLEHHESLVYISAITVAELKKGITLLPTGKKKERVGLWFKEVLATFDDRIFPFDHEVAQTWGDMHARVQSLGHNLPVLDSLNAAIALHHGLTMATRNETDFTRTGVKIVNPWTE